MNLRHPFTQAVLLLIGSYVLIKWGIQYLPPVFGFVVSLLPGVNFQVPSAPVPQSIVFQFVLTALVGILLYVSDNEEKWRRFKQPIVATLVDANKRWLRMSLLVLIPLLVGFAAYDQTRPKVAAPVQLRSIHPAPPARITFRGATMELTGLENPLRHEGNLAEHVRTGRRIYYQNCLPCHGDLLDGLGHYGPGFNPLPLPFDAGTIAQLTESFVFWRIAKGGPGLPREGAPWNSAMPVWEDYLTADEIWAVSIFLYDQAGVSPRTWEEAEASEGGEHE